MVEAFIWFANYSLVWVWDNYKTAVGKCFFTLLGCIWFLLLSCFTLFLCNLGEPWTLLCEGPVIRCSGTIATAEIQSDVIWAPFLIARAKCRVANLACESAETASFLPVIQHQSKHGISLLVWIFFCLEQTLLHIALTEDVNLILQTIKNLWREDDCFNNFHAKD